MCGASFEEEGKSGLGGKQFCTLQVASELLTPSRPLPRSAGQAELKCGWTDVGEDPPRGPDVHPLLGGGEGRVGSIIISQ